MSARVRHPVFARVYKRVSARAEAAGQADHRRELLAGAQGRVIEVGAGNGLNFKHYPTTVDEVVAVEPEAYLRREAERAARRAPVPITVLDGLAGALPHEDASFDAAVASLVLCTVPDVDGALADLRRVIRPGGELRFYEHVLADDARLAPVQRAVTRAGVWPLVAGGCHADRDTAAAIVRAGFVIESCRRFSFRPAALAAPHILGLARRP